MDSVSSATLEDGSSMGFVLSAVCFISVASYFLYRNTYSHWSKLGLKGPTPLPILGNLLPELIVPKWYLDVEWARKYGKCYGIYQGNYPLLRVADPEVLMQVCVKDFDHFMDHDDLGDFINKFQRTFLVFLKGDHWRKIRALMSPTFTSSKIKRMFKLLDSCANDLVECFGEQIKPSGEAGERSALINAKDLYYLFTMDTITTCCYGIKMERVKDAKDLKTVATRNHFVEVAMKMFQFSKLRLLVMIATPKFILRLLDFNVLEEKPFLDLANISAQLITERRKSGKKMDDYLQLLIDARLGDELELNDMDLEENHHAGLTHESLIEDQKKMVGAISKSSSSTSSSVVLSDLEILGNAMFLLSAGLETTGVLLSHCSYALAFHQDVQQRLYEELLKIVELDEEKNKVQFSYESLTSCRYIDAVLSETLRRLSPVPQMNRKVTHDCVIEKYNIPLKKGDHFFICYHAIHMDPDYWPEPERYDPDRFMPGNKEKIVPGSYCPFGLGPRHCIGMRFSLTEAKLALAKILMNFKFEPAPGSKFPPEPKRSIAFAELKNPVVKLVHRN